MKHFIRRNRIRLAEWVAGRRYVLTRRDTQTFYPGWSEKRWKW